MEVTKMAAEGDQSQETETEKPDSSTIKFEDLKDTSEPQTLSKRQKKKLLNYQRWIDTKEERKKREKDKLKLRLEAKRAAGEACGNLRKRLKQVTMAGSSCKQRVAVDMSFDDLMTDKHLAQCVKQISRCYSANRRVADPMQLYVTNFVGKCQSFMARQNGYMNWDIYFKAEKYTDIFPEEELVYLTSESSNVITALDDSKVYVIGGLVDHNLHKGLCYNLALEKGIKHAKLPIDKFIEMKTRKILSVDQVFRILLGVSQGRTWKESFLDAIPPRKGAIGKEDSAEDDEESSEQKIEEGRSDSSQDVPSSEGTKNGKSVDGLNCDAESNS